MVMLGLIKEIYVFHMFGCRWKMGILKDMTERVLLHGASIRKLDVAGDIRNLSRCLNVLDEEGTHQFASTEQGQMSAEC